MDDQMHTHAIVGTAKGEVEVRAISRPSLREDELLVRTEYSGVSQGTEIWAVKGERPELCFPTVLGYQAVGIVEQTGSATPGFSVGQRVLFHTSRLPADLPETWMAAHVALATVPLSASSPPRLVPPNVDPVAASLSAMVAVSLRGIEMLRIRHGDLVVVTGQGLIGQASAQLARLAGATVISTEMSAGRLELSRAHSADIAINPQEANLKELVRSIRPPGADVVIETTGRSDMFADCIDLLRWEGQLLLQGYYPKPITFDFHATHMKKPMVAVTCGIGDTGRVLELLRYNKLHWRELITHLQPVRDAPEMYARMLANDPDVLGVVFDWKGVA